MGGNRDTGSPSPGNRGGEQKGLAPAIAAAYQGYFVLHNELSMQGPSHRQPLRIQYLIQQPRAFIRECVEFCFIGGNRYSVGPCTGPPLSIIELS